MPAKTKRQRRFNPVRTVPVYTGLPLADGLMLTRVIEEFLRDGVDYDQSAIRVGLITDELVERLFEERRRARENETAATLHGS